MRNFKLSLLALCAMLLLVSRMAFALVEIPELTTRVTDLTGTLNAQELASLESKLATFESKKGSQIAVLIVPSTEPEVIEQYSIRVAQKWQLGREKTDDGVLVLIAKDDRKMRIEVGYGLEGAIPDVYAKRIVSEIMRPRFKQGDFYGGIDASVDALISIVDGEALPAPQQQGQIAGAENLLPLFLFGTIFLSLFLTGFLGRFLGSTATGGIVGTTAMSMLASTPAGIAVGIAAFAGSLMLPWLFGGGGGNSGYRRGGGYYGGGLGGGSSGGSSWGGGGGGDFGGGGASGDW